MRTTASSRRSPGRSRVDRIWQFAGRLLAAATTLAALAVSAPGVAAANGSPDPSAAPIPLFIMRDGEVKESSGAALSRAHRLLWTHNDAGNSPVVFGFKPSGEVRVRVTVEGVAAEDWEDIAVATIDGRHWIYIDDVGDAYQARRERGDTFRTHYEIVRFPEPDPLPSGTDLRVEAEVFPVVFEDQESVNVESMAVQDSGAVILIEKLEQPGRPARVWQIERPRVDEPNVAVEVASVPIVGASGADLTVDGTSLVIRDAKWAWQYDLTRGVPQAFATPVHRHALPYQLRGEGVAFTLDARGLVLTSEGPEQSAWFVPFEANVAPRFGPLHGAPATASSHDSTATRRQPGDAAAAWTSPGILLRSLAVAGGVLVIGLGVVVGIRRRAARHTAAQAQQIRHLPVSHDLW